MNEQTVIDRRRSVEGAMMTEREFEAYVKELEIPLAQLESWGTIIDLGSGTQQEFARAIDAKFPDKVVFSIDARLMLSEEEDLLGMDPEETDRRKLGRKNPFKNTIAAYADEMPLEDDSIDAVLAMYSIPMYLEGAEIINRVFNEIYRVLKAGKEARFYPVQSSKNLYELLEWLDRMKREGKIDYELNKKEEVKGVDEKYLLVIKKI